MELKQESVLIEVECPVCKDYLYPPIIICPTGHSICENCSKVLRKCPLCEATLGNGRNFNLEGVLSKFKLPCKNKVSGCEVIDSYTKLKEHQKVCQYGVDESPKHIDVVTCAHHNRHLLQSREVSRWFIFFLNFITVFAFLLIVFMMVVKYDKERKN